MRHRTEPQPPARLELLPAPLDRVAVALLSVCVAITVILGARYWGQSQAGWFDTAVSVRVEAVFGGRTSFFRLIWLGDQVTVAVTTAVLCLALLRRRRLRAALLVAVAVPGACIATELVLKPFIHRTYFGGLAFPSGHATGVFAIAVVVSVLLINPPRPRPRAGVRALVAGGALALAGLVCAAVLGAKNHYPTDVVGGAAVATAAVLLTALALDRLPGRWKRISLRI